LKQIKLEIVNQTFKKIKMKPLTAIGSVTKWKSGLIIKIPWRS